MPNRIAINSIIAFLAVLWQGLLPVRAQSPLVRRLPPISVASLDRVDSSSVLRLPTVETDPSSVFSLIQETSTVAPPERLPAPPSGPEQVPAGTTTRGRYFPTLPPDPNDDGKEPLPPLEEELWLHGGAHLYEPEGEQAHWPGIHEGHHSQTLRLPEDWQKPRPLTLFQEFQGADPIHPRPLLHWPGHDGLQWEPRLVGYGGYELFGFAYEEGDQNQSGIGHQLLVDIDGRITGTERFHVQFRPLGGKNSGGSFYQFSDPEGYIDNSSGMPERYWVEGELFSIFHSLFHDEFIPRDYHAVVGLFPLALQNSLLMNDDILGVAVNKNTIYLGNLSNLNVQLFYGFDEVDAFDVSSEVLGVNATADYRHVLIETTYAHLSHSRDSSRDTDFAAIGALKYFGLFSLGGRAMFKWNDSGGTGAGQLYVLESNWTRAYHEGLMHHLGVEKGIFYANAFHASKGWNPISGGNFDRLRSTFEVNPLVSIARGTQDDTRGVAVGVQLFRRHEDESITPEIAFEAPGGTAVWGAGIRYQRKTGARSYFELRGVGNWSENSSLERAGIFASESILF